LALVVIIVKLSIQYLDHGDCSHLLYYLFLNSVLLECFPSSQSANIKGEKLLKQIFSYPLCIHKLIHSNQGLFILFFMVMHNLKKISTLHRFKSTHFVIKKTAAFFWSGG